MLWMAVTADKYELPLVVEDTQEKLAKKLGISKSTVATKAWKYKNNSPPKTKTGRKPKYRIVAVKE